MKLSIIIVNYNVKYFLEQCLLSVRKACKHIEAEVWMVDNNSVDGSNEMLREKFPEVKLIANTDNKGFSKANNQAIVQSKGEYILLLNPDTVVEEDTFDVCCRFMDEHKEAGGLGVKMLDGTGKFLPESKRGLPTPWVAFYKIFGISKLFPGSKKFGRYHLTYLDKDKAHEIEVLAGAFMMLRKSVLDKIGLLDETFFMYGEDIDLSYRITLSGYKNYYLPETRIIHYKGESTKKSSVNYVFVFYNAMIIFAKKHFSQKNASLFAFIIRVAIYLRASIAIVHRFIKSTLLPLLDVMMIYTGMYFLKEYWGQQIHVQYEPEFMMYIVPAYIFAWITSVYFSGGYDQPVKLSKIARGIITGTFFILVVYALLPETARSSRALILLGALWASVIMVTGRLLINLVGWKNFKLENDLQKKVVIVGEPDESIRVLGLLRMSNPKHNFIGFVNPADDGKMNNTAEAQISFKKSYLGKLSQLKEILEVYAIDEVIFCSKDIPLQSIISFMSQITNKEIEYKIAPPESLYIIGSNSVDNPGEMYAIDMNSISRNVNRRNKRVVDVLLSFIFLLISPVLIFIQKYPFGLFKNIFRVMTGKFSWVGYKSLTENIPLPDSSLPKIRSGVLNPLDAVVRKGSSGEVKQLDEHTISKLNLLYAKDYRVENDLNIIRKGLRELGRG